MSSLGISREEALQVIEDDKRIDRGEKLFELPDELKAGAKKARQAERKPTVYNFPKKERKADNDKRFLIDAIQDVITINNGKDVKIINPEREIEFFYNSKKYKIVLSCPRS